MKFLTVHIEAGISGFESPAAEYRELSLNLDDFLIKRPNSTFLGIANGDSMVGLGIFNGDILIIDRAETVQHLDVVVVIYNGNFSCKILDKVKKQLISASSQHTPIDIDPNDSFVIEGVVINSIRQFRVNQNNHVFPS